MDKQAKFLSSSLGIIMQDHAPFISEGWRAFFIGFCIIERERVTRGEPVKTYDQVAAYAKKTAKNKVPQSLYEHYVRAYLRMAKRWKHTTCQITPNTTPNTPLENQTISKEEVTKNTEPTKKCQITPNTTPNTTPSVTPNVTPNTYTENQEDNANEVKKRCSRAYSDYKKEEKLIKEKLVFLNTQKGAEWEAWAFSILSAGNGSKEEKEAARYEHRVSLIAMLFFMGKGNSDIVLKEAQSIYGMAAGRLLACMGNQHYAGAAAIALMYGGKLSSYLDRHSKGIKEWQGDKLQYVLNGINKEA